MSDYGFGMFLREILPCGPDDTKLLDKLQPVPDQAQGTIKMQVRISCQLKVKV